MSTINKLSIRGIRSFGCEREDEQKIVFSSPLTLIVGQNGCGKTTIIESLKFALTGEMPGQGQTFVHDPKVFKTTSSSAQIKLMITDVMGRSITCIRSMRNDILKGGKTKFTTTDCTIIYEDASGRREESGRRVEEVNNEMSMAMGVSKAILNNVIFCHQEDSNWPMDEGKKLKEKFDAIFGTTEYNKAIERIIKHRKNFEEKRKYSEHEKKHLLEIKGEADRKRFNHEKLKEDHDKTKATIAEIDEQLVPVQEEMNKIMIKQKEYAKLYARKESYNLSITNCEANIETTKQKIKTLLDCSVDDLKQQLESFNENQKENKEKLAVLKVKLEKASSDEKKHRAAVVEAKSSMGLVSDQIGKKQDLESDRLKAIKELSADLNIPMSSDADTQSMTADDLTSSVDKIEREISRKETKLSDEKSHAEKKDHEYQQEIDKTREQKTTSETNLKTQRDQLSKLSKSKEEMQAEVSSIESSMPKFQQLLSKITETEKELEAVKSSHDIEDLDDKTLLFASEREELEGKIAAVEKELDMLETIFGLTSNLEIKENDVSKDQQDFNRLKNKNSSSLKKLFPEKSVDHNYKNVVQSLSDELNETVKRCKEDLQEARMKKNRYEADRTHLQNQLKAKIADIDKTKERIDSACGSRDFKDCLASQKEKVEKLNLDLGYDRSSDKMFKRYIEEIEGAPCCPLCHKDLESNESFNLQEEIKESIRGLPSRIATKEKELKLESKKFDELNGLKSSFENVEKLEKEVRQQQDELKQLKAKIVEVESSIGNFESQLTEPEMKLKVNTPTFFSDMCRLDELSRSISTKTKEVENLKAKLPAEMPAKTLAEAKDELRKFNASLKQINEKVNQLNKESNETQARINAVQDQLNNFISQKMKQQEKFQGVERMKTQLKELEVQKSDLTVKIQEEERKLSPTKAKLNKLVQEKQSAKDEATKRAEALQKRIDDFKRQQSDIDRISREFKTHENMKLENKMKELQSKIDFENDRVNQLEAEIRKKSKEYEKLNNDLSNQETVKRNLQDNMELQRFQMEKQEAEENLAKLEKEVGHLNPKKIEQDSKIFNEKYQKLNADRFTFKGKLQSSENEIAKSEKEINEPRYKKANENYLQECNNEAVAAAIVSDLNKYRAVLERSLLKYHGDKMKEINNTIRELWSNIYKGNDIDYIMIKTDADDAPKTVSDKKRSYSYRVVQAKNGGAEIDMRGRCSAGQKVLASLIIRMALADTFSANCGILALDEPTTNLDHTNINSLVDSLRRIVEERERNGNFMLLVITHDMQFVRDLERAEHYFQLSRDPRGRSRIEKKDN